MAGLAVLLPLAMGVPWYLEREAMLESGAMPPEPVPVSGSTTELAGTEWDFRGTVIGETEGAPLADDLELVDAVYAVTPGDAAASGLLEQSCSFRAIDDRGRSWEPTSEFDLRDQLPADIGSTGFGCTGADAEPLPAGEETGLVVSFVVPDDAVDSLRFEVRAPTRNDIEASRPAAVLFSQQD
ncbi:hypothetical protein ACFOVU_28645 [Nocardiopsis sediminis]|uniref:DUF4352 domain-containing protein n=1 Tax=Nocardiopsis sediminis TaxID=1778267 RepID=A0ABV8FYU6_9ACTN